MPGALFSLGTVGVRDAQSGQDLALQGLHGLRLGVVLVVVTQQVQHPVDHQMPQVIGQTLTLRPRLRGADPEREGKVAQGLGSGQARLRRDRLTERKRGGGAASRVWGRVARAWEGRRQGRAARPAGEAAPLLRA